MPRALILISVAAVVPAFFVLMWLVSSYHRLVMLRERLKRADAVLQTQLIAIQGSMRMREGDASENFTLAIQAYDEAVIDYNEVRDTFPSNAIAWTFHLARAESFSFDRVSRE